MTRSVRRPWIPGLLRLPLFMLQAWLATALMYVIFDSNIHCMSWGPSQVMLILAEALLLTVPVMALRRHWRVLTLVTLWIVAIFFLANIIYYRYWSNLLPVDQIFRTASYNSVVFSSGLGMLKASDLWFLVIPVLLTAAYCLLRVWSAPAPPLSKALGYVGLSMLLWIGAQGCSLMYSYYYWRHVGNPRPVGELANEQFIRDPNCSRLIHWNKKELLLYLWHQVRSIVESGHTTLDDGQRAEIAAFLDANSRMSAASLPDSLFAGNARKNLIVVIAESLNADALGQILEGRRLTPTIDSLLALPGTVSARNVVSQISDGRSSDGQFMYNTGLLPLRGQAVAMNFPDNHYSSLCQAIGYDRPLEVDFVTPGIWNHNLTSRAFHYDRLVHSLQQDGLTQDSRVFTRTLQEIDSLPRPFMVQSCSMTMHAPFTDPEMPRPEWIAKNSKPGLADYNMALNAFDTALGEFITGLRVRGLYDDTVIVVVSDHDIDPVDDDATRHPILFMALNTGQTMRIDRTVGQVDVYPTILQIMHRNPAWKGVGTSILNPDNKSAATIEGSMKGTSGALADSLKLRAWNISRLMIRGDYFRKCEK